MATRFDGDAGAASPGVFVSGSLADPACALIGPRRDALLLWGAPLLALLMVELWLSGWAALAPAAAQTGALLLVTAVGVLTFAHLVAVVPRAYLNCEVFAAHRIRLTLVPVALLALLLVSPTALIAAGIVAVLWDVHHSAMQNFGFARLYDMKAGNPPALLRAADLRLNWVMYVGPLAAGAALGAHFVDFARLDGTMLAALTGLPGVLEGRHDGIRIAAILAYAGVVGWAAGDYARAIRAGYRIPAHKLALLGVSGGVSLLAWGFAPPLVALAAINLYHAVQYFALVWLKEGARMTRAGWHPARALALFGGGCAAFGLAYWAVAAGRPGLALAPFVACSLLHFWYDGFVWSVRRRQV